MAKKAVFATAALVAALGIGVYYLAPEVVREPLLELNRSTAGLEEKVLQVGDHQVHYLEGGQGETLVLLHGIFAEKDHWVDFSRELTDRYHVIALDIPGFGESTRLPDGNYDYASQVKRLRALLEQLGVGPVHLAGNSMGGALAAFYAIDYPQEVKSLAFIGAPHGIQSAEPSEMDRMIEAQKVALVTHTPEEFEAMLDLVFEQRPLIPYPVYAASEASAIRLAQDNERIFNQQLKNRFLLQSQLPLIEAPTLALWGAKDRIFHISGAEELRRDLPTAQVVALENIGHLPQMEAPKETAALYAEFLSKL